MTNTYRMPLQEWHYRMAEARVPPQAQALAMVAVLYQVTSNEELAKLTCMDTKGIADKTYNKWKRYLSDNGWVRVTAVTVGRVTTIEVIPSLDTVPVTFTNIKPMAPRRFYERNNYERTVISTDVESCSPVEVTNEHVTITNEQPSAVKATSDQSAASRARIESSRREDTPLTPLKNNNSRSYLDAERASARAREGPQESAITVNCSAIHGPGFTLDFGAIDMAAALAPIPKERARMIAEVCARDWVANNKIPQAPMAVVRAAIQGDFTRGRVAQVQIDKATAGTPRRTFKR